MQRFVRWKSLMQPNNLVLDYCHQVNLSLIPFISRIEGKSVRDSKGEREFLSLWPSVPRHQDHKYMYTHTHTTTQPGTNLPSFRDHCPLLVINQHCAHSQGKWTVNPICPRVTGWVVQASLHISAHLAPHNTHTHIHTLKDYTVRWVCSPCKKNPKGQLLVDGGGTQFVDGHLSLYLNWPINLCMPDHMMRVVRTICSKPRWAGLWCLIVIVTTTKFLSECCKL